jgi:hypothetical protein
MAIHRIHLTEARLERRVSATIADLERYRKELERRKAPSGDQSDKFIGGLVWANPSGSHYFEVLPQVRGLDGKWRDIPREALADPGKDAT